MTDATYREERAFFRAKHGIRLTVICGPLAYGRVEPDAPFFWRLRWRHMAPYLGLTTKDRRATLPVYHHVQTEWQEI